jgi:hypothetical protein
MVAVSRTRFREPMPDPSPDQIDNVGAALLGQVPPTAGQICDGMLVIDAAALRKNRDGLAGPGNVLGIV